MAACGRDRVNHRQKQKANTAAHLGLLLLHDTDGGVGQKNQANNGRLGESGNLGLLVLKDSQDL